MWKCFKTVIVEVFHSDNLKKEKQSDQCGSVSKQSLSKCFTVPIWKRVAKRSMWKCFKTVIVKVFQSDNLKTGSKVINVEVFQNSHCQSVLKWQPEKRVAKWSMWKCFKKVIVKVFQWQPVKGKQSDHCRVFQNSHCQSVSQWQPVKGSKVIIVEVFWKSHYQNVSQMTT